MVVQIDFISFSSLKDKTSEEKIKFILNHVKQDKILVLDTTLDLDEEKQLISQTMANVTKNFPGIEVSTLGRESDDLRTRLIKLLGGKTTGLTVIGPTNLVKQLKKDPDKLKLLAGT